MTIWWKDIIAMCFDDGDSRWLDHGVRRVVGDGRGVSFWQECWVGQEKLQDKYSRLYNLSIQKNYFVSDLGFWRDGSWHWNFLWRRSLLAHEEEMVAAFTSEINSVALAEGKEPKWLWLANDDSCYTVKSAFCLLQRKLESPAAALFLF